jgi:hypothetical protein
LPFVKPEIAGDKTVFLTDGALKSMLPPGAPNHMIQRTVVQTFANFKAGQ